MSITHTHTEIPESHRDLLETDIAILATVGSDGLPQQSPVWFIADGDHISTSLNTSRQKTKNLTKNPVVDLVILDLKNPYRYLEVRGRAIVEPDSDFSFARRLGAKYKADLSKMDAKGDLRVIVSIQPTRVNAVDMSS